MSLSIAFLVWEFPLLSETFILNLITGLIDRGHEVDIYAHDGRPIDAAPMHPDVEKYHLLTRTYYALALFTNPEYSFHGELDQVPELVMEPEAL